MQYVKSVVISGMCKRRNIKKIVSIILILFCFGLLCGCSLGKPKFEMNYKIGNNTSVGYISGVAYSTFSVEGTVTIKNYKTDLIVITADAYGSSGDFIHIFTTVNINGDGVYSFKMESFYKNGVDWVTDITNIKVKEP